MKLIDMYFWQIGLNLKKEGVPARNSKPALLKPTVTLSSARDGVQSGTSENGVKRVCWYGHSGFSVARWCGAQGWSREETIKVFECFEIRLGRSAILGGVYAGKSGTRGQPANLTRDQVAQMEDARNGPGIERPFRH